MTHYFQIPFHYIFHYFKNLPIRKEWFASQRDTNNKFHLIFDVQIIWRINPRIISATTTEKMWSCNSADIRMDSLFSPSIWSKRYPTQTEVLNAHCTFAKTGKHLLLIFPISMRFYSRCFSCCIFDRLHDNALVNIWMCVCVYIVFEWPLLDVANFYRSDAKDTRFFFANSQSLSTDPGELLHQQQ